jgi:ATP-dependent Clp protease ATP-binding subunit ClpA
MPWCVVLLESVHACHPQVREVLVQALSTGYLTDARGKRIYLSDAVVLLTADVAIQLQRPLGFVQGGDSATEDLRQAIGDAVGAELAAQLDLVIASVPTGEAPRRRWLEKHLLSDLADRYRKQGVELSWDDSLVAWLLREETASRNQREWERLVDERLSPLLIRYLPSTAGKEVRCLLVKCEGDEVLVETRQPEQGETRHGL